MNNTLKKEAHPVAVMIVLFVISTVGLLTWKYVDQRRLERADRQLKTAVKEALIHGADKDSLKGALVGVDSLR